MKYILPTLTTIVAISLCFIPLELSHYFNDQLIVSKQFTEDFVNSTFLLCLPLLIPAYFFRHWIASSIWGIGIFTMSIQFFLLNMHWHLYKQPINASTMFILLESNLAESSEYISTYFDSYLVEQITIYSSYAIVSAIALHYLTRYVSKFNFKLRFGLAITAVILAIAYNTVYEVTNQTIVQMAAEGYREYQKESEKYDEYKFHESLGNQKVFKRENQNSPENFVIVIGESTARSHMSLYGYYRNTNPKLSEIEHELLIYSDVISPHTNTINSLSEVLTPGDAIDEDKKFVGSLIQFFNAGGFETYWFSNQRPVGVHENLVTKIAKAADRKVFINTLTNNLRTPFDSTLIPLLAEALNEPTPKNKAVFLHLMGSHAKYNYRYPSHYKVFKDSAQSINFHTESSKRLVNEYDNTILYNDMVVRSIIELAKNASGSTCVIYFSDHGEDVFEHQTCACHTENKGTPSMYEVPFIVWLSEDFNNHHSITIEKDRPYMLDNFVHSVADIANLQFQGFDSSKSIFSPNFKVIPRIIQSNIDYDKKFIAPISNSADMLQSTDSAGN